MKSHSSSIQKHPHRRNASRPELLFFILPFPLIAAIIALGIAFGALLTKPVTSDGPVNSQSVVTTETARTPNAETDPAVIVDLWPDVEPAFVPGDPDAPRIYLTFDDGPSDTSTPQILEVLNRYGAKATFFIMGSAAAPRADMIRLEHERGHTIAVHSYSHNYEEVYSSAAAFMADIEQCEAILTEILGEPPPRILRFPAGSAATELEDNPQLREDIKAQLAAGGWKYFDWLVSFGDSISGWTPNVGDLASNVIANIDEQVEAGNRDIVVLAHDVDIKPWTVADVPLVVSYCLKKGYVLAPLTMDTPAYQYR
jgi:peptidoglycan/xylan/chitin deacetylase (PgdA/CDA1 family)